MPTPYLRNKSWKHMSLPISLKDITIYPVVEQQGAFFDVMEFAAPQHPYRFLRGQSQASPGSTVLEHVE
jgi:hypothetical protein